MPPADAARAARRSFGSVDRMAEAYRDQQGLPFLDALASDVRFAWRLLLRNPSFSVTAILVLALGIGVNNMFFSILHAHTMRGLPLPDADRVVWISTREDGGATRGISGADVEAFERRARSLASLAALTAAPMVVVDEGRPAERLDGAFVSASAWTLARANAVAGRTFAAADDAPGAASVAVLGEGLWHARYGADPGVLGRSIHVNGVPSTVIGIVPDRTGLPSTAEVWLPLAQRPGAPEERRNARSLELLGRLQDGATLEQAQAELTTIVESLAPERPGSPPLRARVMPVNERYLGSMTEPVWLAFLAAGSLIAVIACANVATLLLARSVQRARELAIRTSIGASRIRLIRQLLIESALIAVCGGLAGFALSRAGLALFRTAIPDRVLPYWIDYSADARIAAALIAVTIATVFVFGLLPAVHASRTDVNHVLKDGAHTSNGRRGGLWTTAFLSAEFALAVVLLSMLAAQIRTTRPEIASDDLLDSTDLVTATLTLPAAAYSSAVERAQFYRQLDERLRAQPAIISTSVASVLPLSGGDQRTLAIPGQAPSGHEPVTVRTVAISPSYFQTIGVTTTRGRDFTDLDGTPGHGSVIVNERFAQKFFPDRDPIGQTITLAQKNAATADQRTLNVIGIAPIIRQSPLAEPEPIAYLPLGDSYPATAVLIARGVATADTVSTMKAAVQAIDPHLPLYRTRTMSQAVRDAGWNGRLGARLFLTITLLAVVLTTAGLFAVAVHTVSQRTRELGLRMALGAGPGRIAAVVARRLGFQVLVGYGAGIVCSMAWSSFFPEGGSGAQPTDPQSLLIVGAMLLAMAVAACAIPTRRAMRLNPLDTIRCE
jgi:putative ABC transport system permease protein